jgi:hypothetical protein
MDTGVILYAAELEVPALRQTARRILEAEAKRFGVSPDTGGVLLRRAEGGPELHVVAAAEELLMHLMAGTCPPASAKSAPSSPTSAPTPRTRWPGCS